MKKIIIIMLVLLCVVLSGCVEYTHDHPHPHDDDDHEDTFYDNYTERHNLSTFTVANWNLQIYGKTKAGKEHVLEFYDEMLSEYDIIFVQEIRDSSETAFPKLCAKFEGYDCIVSDREGRTSSKEQIGVIYKEYIDILGTELIADPDDVYERSPLRVDFNVSGYVFTAYNAHLKPSDVENEMQAFYGDVKTTGNVMVLGDLNAGCSYYNEFKDDSFDDWWWSPIVDSTVAGTDCAYDRIIANSDMMTEVIKTEVISDGIVKEYSDHYIIYAEVLIGDTQ
jgi:hypothetical protein